MASMSRWLVGSSSSSRSGSETSALPSSARRRQPPDSSRIGRSAGSASRETTVSTFCSSRQPSRSSSWCCSSPSRASAAGHRRRSPPRAPPRGGSRRRGRQARRGRSRLRRRPSGRPTPGTSCSSRAMRSAGRARPCPPSGGISPEMTFSRLDLPVPFRPMSAMRSPGSMRRSAASKSGRWPNASATESRVMTGTGYYSGSEDARSHVARSTLESRRASTAQTACASRRRSCRAMSPHQNSPVTTSHDAGTSPISSGALCSAR